MNKINSPIAPSGFTLIELLIVIAVIGVLSASVLSAINPLEQFAKTRDAGRKSSVTQLGKALNGDAIERGGYMTPSDTWINTLVTRGELNVAPEQPSAITTECAATGTDTGVQNNFCYKVNGKKAIIYSKVESKGETEKCDSATETAYYLWSSINNGKAGIICLTTDTNGPAVPAGAGSFTFK